MRLVPAVGTLVSFWESNVSLQICPPFCDECIAFISIRIDSIDMRLVRAVRTLVYVLNSDG
eukprot:scaffold125858_cov26-Attheya_sp.AAC.1